MLNPAETVQRFNEIIAHPKRGWLAADREGRLKEAPVTTIIKGLVRHTIFFLAKIIDRLGDISAQLVFAELILDGQEICF